MTRLLRIVLVTGGLALVGAFTGALCGVLALIPLLLRAWLPGGVGHWLAGFWDVAPWAAGAGAVLGAFLGPLLAWSLLRHVSLWRVITWAVGGTVLGSFAGFAAAGNPMLPGLGSIFAGAILGMIAAGVALRVRSARSQEAADMAIP